MLRYMSWIQSLQLYQNVSGARPPLSQAALACIVAMQAKMISGTSRATGDPMGMHTTKVAVGEGKFALEEALEAPSIRAALAM